MRRWSRRRFIGAAAAVCAGCTGDDSAAPLASGGSGDDGPTSVPPTTAPASTVPPVPLGSVRVGTIGEVASRIADDGAVYVPQVRAFVVAIDDGDVEAAVAAHDEALHAGFRAGFVALFEKCPHLGCRVPFCESSGWFECACHGAAFNRIGEHQLGPSERGLDLFEVHVVGDDVYVRAAIHRGLPTGSGVASDAARGPHCVEISPRRT